MSTAESQPRSEAFPGEVDTGSPSGNASHPESTPLRLILMGVAGSGKSTVGAVLSEALSIPYRDGDDLHPPANIAKMSRGEPLDDADRWPWLQAVARALAVMPDGGIIGCSALKRRYRDLIRDTAGVPVTFVHLSGSRAVIAERMAHRPGHFMPPSLLDSQFAALEPPGPDEGAITVDIAEPVADVVRDIVRAVRG
jgi:gluconokinase